MDMNKKKSSIFGIIAVAILLLFDQLTKYMATIHLKEGNSIILIKDVFQLHYLENRGAAFGMFQGGKIWFVIITVLIVAILIYAYWKSPMQKKFLWLRIIIIFLMAGAFGNLIDRIRLDYVIDFFYFDLIDFPIFNVADIYVSCGVAVLIILFIFYYKEEDMDQLWPARKKKNERNK